MEEFSGKTDHLNLLRGGLKKIRIEIMCRSDKFKKRKNYFNLVKSSSVKKVGEFEYPVILFWYAIKTSKDCLVSLSKEHFLWCAFAISTLSVIFELIRAQRKNSVVKF